jgi:hypothetical protein
VHCDVDSYPTTFPEDTRWKVAVAIHPRNSPFVTDEEFQEFTALLARPEVSALGEGRAHWMETRSIWKEKDNVTMHQYPSNQLQMCLYWYLEFLLYQLSNRQINISVSADTVSV